jgi:hypothetical protein
MTSPMRMKAFAPALGAFYFVIFHFKPQDLLIGACIRKNKITPEINTLP